MSGTVILTSENHLDICPNFGYGRDGETARPEEVLNFGVRDFGKSGSTESSDSLAVILFARLGCVFMDGANHELLRRPPKV